MGYLQETDPFGCVNTAVVLPDCSGFSLYRGRTIRRETHLFGRVDTPLTLYVFVLLLAGNS